MRLDTQQSIHDAQQAIISAHDEDILPTRATVARLANKSISWITKLVQRFPEYINDDGSGNLIIVQSIKPAPKLLRKSSLEQPGNTMSRDQFNTDLMECMTIIMETHAIVGTATSRIAEALETIIQTGGSNLTQTGREITKNSAPVGLIPKELRKKLTDGWKVEQWKPYANIWQDYLKSQGITSLYLLHQTIEFYLSKRKDELVQAIQDKLDGKEKPVETKPAYSGPPRLPTYEELGISTETHSWDIGTLFLNKTINRTGYQLRTVVDRGYDSFHRRQDITVQDAKDGKLIDEWNARPENENLQVDDKGLLILPIVTRSGESNGSPASN